MRLLRRMVADVRISAVVLPHVRAVEAMLLLLKKLCCPWLQLSGKPEV